jgi:hypothetical protein
MLVLFKNAVMTVIELLSGLVGSSLIFWVVIGAITHAKWIQKIVKSESLKINTQNLAIEQHGYRSIKPSNRSFYAKRGFVFGYWDSEIKPSELAIESQNSPKIFDIACINLVAFTSIFFLISLSKGLFNIISFG